MHHTQLNTVFLLLFWIGLSTSPVIADPKPRWPSWRGANSTGSLTEGTFPSKLTQEHIVWKAPLEGKGCSTPAIWDDLILVTSPIEGHDAVLAFDFQGNRAWSTKIDRERAGKHRNGSGSNPSPVTDGKHIFAYFKSGTLAALTMSGRQLWKTNLQKEFGSDSLYWDLGTTPVVTEAHVVVAVMQGGDSFLVAYDKATGDQAWKVDRNYKTPVECDHSYATPIVRKVGDREVIIVWGAEHLTGHDATDGEELWSCGGFNPDENRNWVAVASHVMADDMAIVPYGRGAHLVGIQVGGSGDITGSHRKWTLDGVGSFVPTPAVDGDRVYILGDKGDVFCIEAKTGKTVWQNRFPKNRNKFYSSPTIAGGKMYAAREDGVVFVAKIGKTFELLSENSMRERVIASPVPVGDAILIRGEKNLYFMK